MVKSREQQGLGLTLVPPATFHIPPALLSHTLRPAPVRLTLKKGSLPVPAAFTSIEKQLRSLGLELPTLLAADRAAWWGVAVKSVEWDLEENEVKVALVDGSEERWELSRGGRALSKEWVENSDLEEEESKMEWGPPDDENGEGARRSWEPPPLHVKLLALCLELREVYEDLGMGVEGASLSTDEEHEDLIALAADRSKPIPPHLAKGGAYSMRDEGEEPMSSEEDEVEEVESIGSPKSPGSQTSQLRPINYPPPGEATQIRGQLKSTTRRPLDRTPPSATSSSIVPSSSPFDPLSSTRPTHDIVSAVAVLAKIRLTLLDLFATSILSTLKQRLPPTFSIWVTSSALAWCRRGAIRKGAALAEELLKLMDPDHMFEDEEEQDDDELSGGESEDGSMKGIGRGRSRSRSFSGSESSYECGSDYVDVLREWCQGARIKADRTRNSTETGGGDLWIDDIDPWEVTRPFVPPPVTTGAKHPKKRTPTCPTSPLRDYSDSPAASDIDDDSSDSDSDFFYPADLLGEELLPPRLPRAVLEDGLIHSELNAIAGLQIRMEKLKRFTATQMENWERNNASDRGDLAAFREARRKKSPEVRPLQIVTADKAVAHSLLLALEPGENSKSRHKKKNKERIKASTLAARQSINAGFPSSPRKRKHSNLVVLKALSSVEESFSKEVRSPFDGVVMNGGSKRRKLDATISAPSLFATPPPAPSSARRRMGSMKSKTRAKAMKPSTISASLHSNPPKAPAQSSHPHSPTRSSPLLVPHLPIDPSQIATIATTRTSFSVPPPAALEDSDDPTSPTAPCSRLSLQELSVYRQGLVTPSRPVVAAHWQDWQGGEEEESNFVEFGFAGLDRELDILDPDGGASDKEEEEIGVASLPGTYLSDSDDEQDTSWDEVTLYPRSLTSVAEEDDIQVHDDFEDVLRWTRDQRTDFPIRRSPPLPKPSTTPPSSPSAYPVSSERSLPLCVAPELTIRPLTPLLGVANVNPPSPPVQYPPQPTVPDRSLGGHSSSGIACPIPVRPLLHSTASSRLATLVAKHETKVGRLEDPCSTSIPPSLVDTSSKDATSLGVGTSKKSEIGNQGHQGQEMRGEAAGQGEALIHLLGGASSVKGLGVEV